MNRFASSSLVALLTLIMGCEPPPPPVPGALNLPGATVVTVNGTAISQGVLDATLRQLPDQVRDQLEKTGQLERVNQQLVLGELLYQEALKRKLPDDPEVKAALALAERNALADAVLEAVVKEQMTEDYLKKWYDEHQVQFAQAQFKLAFAVVDTEDAAKAIVDQVAAGANFNELAKASSKDPNTAPNGGSIGWFKKSDLRPPLNGIITDLGKGQASAPIQTPAGWQVFYVEDRRDQIPFEEARETIEKTARNELVENYLKDLEKGATVTWANKAGEAAATPDGAAPAAPAAPAGEGQ